MYLVVPSAPEHAPAVISVISVALMSRGEAYYLKMRHNVIECGATSLRRTPFEGASKELKGTFASTRAPPSTED